MITNKLGVVALVLTGALVSGLSCGGGGGGSGTCAMAGTCGGNVVGNWKITSSCIKASGSLGDSTCPGATVDGSLSVTGTAAFTADASYSLAFVLSGSETIFFPASCLTSNGVTVTCDQLNQVFMAMPLDPTTITSIHCASAGGGACNCTANLASSSTNESGTYTTSGGTLTTTSTAGDVSTDGYCVQGNHLDLTPPANMADPTLTMSGDITLTKQ